MNQRGVTLVELLIVIGIIAILAAIAVPSYVGYQKRAARSEAYANLEALRLLEEQYFAQNGSYAPSTGICGPDNPGNIALINAVLPGFKPGDPNALQFSYCIQNTTCFIANAFGNTGSRVEGDSFWIDCNNKKNF